MVNEDILGKRWKELAKKIRPRWTAFSDQDVASIDGNLVVMVELLRERYGYTPAQAEAEVDRFLEENGDPVPARSG